VSRALEPDSSPSSFSRRAVIVAALVAVGCEPSIGDDSGLICTGEVEIEDAGLWALLFESLPEPPEELSDKAVWGPDLLALPGLNARDAEIESLEGLQCAHGLTTLGLGGNAIVDLEPLRRMAGLRELELSGNAIADVEPLGALPRLEKLGLSDNSVTDASPLSNLPALTHVDLSGNGIADVGPLAEIETLETLALARNGLSDLAPLASLPGLLSLELQQNEIEDVGPLSGLASLRFLNLDLNAVADLAPLAGLSKLETLRLAENGLDGLDALSGLSSLVSIRVKDNAITSLAGLEDSAALRVIDIESNALSDIGVAAQMPVLERISARFNDVRDVSAFEGLQNLRHVDLRDNPGLTDITALGTLPLLGYLGMGGGEVTPDLAPLSGAPVLASLEIRDSGPVGLSEAGTWPMLTALVVVNAPVDDADLGGVASIAGLRALTLRNTGVADVSEFASTLLLQYLDFSENPAVVDVAYLSTMIDLQSVNLASTGVSDVAWASEPQKLSLIDVRETAVDDVAAVVQNSFFRNGDILNAGGSALGVDDCSDLGVLLERDTDVRVDFECP
jgi:Leucine-rich repeat (LRR) protein